MQGPFAAIAVSDPFAPMLAGPWHASKLYLISFHAPLDHRYVHDSEAPLGKVLEIEMTSPSTPRAGNGPGGPPAPAGFKQPADR